MSFLLGIVIKVLTFPGLIVDAFVNEKLCNYLNLEILGVNYLAIGENQHPVMHDFPKTYVNTITIAFVPFLLMSIFAIFLFYFSQLFSDYSYIYIELFFIWLGVSMAVHSFPNPVIGDMLWDKSLKETKKGNYIAVLGLPLTLVIYIARFLHIFWIDLIYGFILYYIFIGENGLEKFF